MAGSPSLTSDMLMWVLAVVLVGGFATLGFQLGGIRASVCFIGALLGLALATVLGGLVEPLLPKLGVVSRAWLLVLPAVIGFGIVWLIALGGSFAAHRPVELHFKYREDDLTREGFERMNRAIGLFVGMLTGVILLFAVGRPIYSRAYLTTQLGSDAEVAPISYINSVRQGMAATGWDRTFNPLDKTTPKFHSVADLLGLLYANPALTNRILVYPPFLALVERSEVADVLGDPEYLKLISDQAGFTALLNHPKTQAIIGNGEIREALGKLDLADVKKYLETGKSPKFDDERLLGRWRPDMAAIITDARRRRTNLPSSDLKNLRTTLNALFAKATLTFYPDGRFAMRVPPPELPAAPAPPVAADGTAPAGFGGPPTIDPALAQRYGLRPGVPAAAAAPAAPAVDPATLFRQMAERVLGDASKPGTIPDFNSEGTWTRSGDRYTLTFATGSQVREGVLQENGRFVIPIPEQKLTLVFIPAS